MEYQIGEFSQIARLSVKTLRFYHEEGLLKPVRTDAVTGYRYYDNTSAERALVIHELRDLGFSIKDIKEILSLCRDDEDVIPFLKKRSGEISRKIEEYRAMSRKIAEFIQLQEEIATMNIDRNISIKDIQDMTVASIRFRGKYEDVGLKIGPLMKAAGRYASGGPFTLYHDPEYADEGADMELCVPVTKMVNQGEVTSRKLPGGKAVTVVHQGPYTTIGESYKKVFDYLKEINAETVVPSREVYLKGPGMIFSGNPKKYLTEIQVLTVRK